MKLIEHQLPSAVELNDELWWKVYISPNIVSGVAKKDQTPIPQSCYDRFEISNEERKEYETNFGYLFPRLRGHIQRLCSDGRSAPENFFGLAITKFHPDPKSEDESLLPRVATHEQKASTWWWTLSPYIMYDLCSEGYPVRDVFDAICNWGDNVHDYDDSLPGLEEEIKRWGVQTLLLNPDPKHITHVYTNALAKKVIESVKDFYRFRKDEIKDIE